MALQSTKKRNPLLCFWTFLFRVNLSMPLFFGIVLFFWESVAESEGERESWAVKTKLSFERYFAQIPHYIPNASDQ